MTVVSGIFSPCSQLFVPMLWKIILPPFAGWLYLLNAVTMWWKKMCWLQWKVWGNFANHREVGIKIGFLPSTTMTSGAPTVDSAALHSGQCCTSLLCMLVLKYSGGTSVSQECLFLMNGCLLLSFSECMRGVHHMPKNQSSQFILLGSV